MANVPVTDVERDRVAELHAQGQSRAQIARELGRSPNTVGRIATAAGLSWDRTRTEQATRARQADLAGRRAELAALLLEDAFRIRERLYAQTIVYAFTKEGDYVEHLLPSPPSGDLRNTMTTIAVAVDKHIALVKVDTAGAEDEKGMIGELFERLRAARDAHRRDKQ